MDWGCADYIRNLNEKGGIDGVKMKFVGVDTRYDVAMGISAYKRHRTEHNLVMVNLVSSALAKALTPLIEADKLVAYNPADPQPVAFPGRTFLWATAYPNVFASALDWMANDWKAKGNSGIPKVGYMQWDNQYGYNSLLGGKEYAEQKGIALQIEFFPPGTLDHSPWLTRLASEGVNYIYTGGIDPNPTLLIKDAYNMGLTKTIQMVSDPIGPEDIVGGRLYPKALEGTVVVSHILRGAEAREHPLAKELWLKYRGKPASEMCSWYAFGIKLILPIEAAIKGVLDDVGYEKFDSEAFYQALQNTTGLDQLGITGPVTYSKTERQCSNVVKFYQLRNGENVPISGWISIPDAVHLHKW
jgi:branched-chain amino acid transport system substrate-binding protein